MPTRHSGTLTQKMLRQPNAAMSAPPTTGPAAIDTAPAAVHRLTARARKPSSWPQDWLSSTSEFGSMAAAPTPCNARAAMSWLASAANPHAADASPNSASPVTNSCRAPKRSPSTPAESISAANASA